MKLIFQKKRLKNSITKTKFFIYFTSEGIINYKITTLNAYSNSRKYRIRKTTLTGLLAKHFKWEPHYEDVVDNPYLDDFYHQMERWSFNLQIYFKQSFPSSDTNGKERKSFKTERSMKTLIYLRPTFMRWVWWLIVIFRITLLLNWWSRQ
jgi:hypothetical protein